MARIKKAQTGKSVDSTAIYKKRAVEAGNKLMRDDVRKVGKNIKDYAEKQSQWKKEERKGKPGYDEKGNRKPLSSMLKFKKSKKGGSFPDLNKDGKITKADILKGRGVIKNGGKLKKARGGASLSPTVSSVSKRLGSSKKLKVGGTLSPSKSSTSRRLSSAHTRKAMGGAKMMKMGGKCRGGCY